MLYFSYNLKNKPNFYKASINLNQALFKENIHYEFLEIESIWLRDFMPVITKSGKYISFRYEPSYLENENDLNAERADREHPFLPNLVFSNINLDGGNVVFSPLKEKAIISSRVFDENPEYEKDALVKKLENLLEAKIIIIPSLKSDMTGHADGMARFVDGNTCVVNESASPHGLESKIKKVLQNNNIKTIDFPYFETNDKSSDGVKSAIGCYINYLETDSVIFLPIFGCKTDKKALNLAKQIFDKKVVGVNINEIALHGGLLNCISWNDA